MREKDLKRLFGQRVQQLRRLKGFTQEQLAEKISRSVDTISNIERGFSSTRIETAVQLAKALGVTPSELFEFSGMAADKDKGRRKELTRLLTLLQTCPLERLPVLSKLIEQAVQLSSNHR